MLVIAIGWLAAVLLMAGYDLVWLLCPRLRAWMEAPRGRFFRQFTEVVRRPAPSPSAQGGPKAADRVPGALPLPRLDFSTDTGNFSPVGADLHNVGGTVTLNHSKVGVRADG
jgi:hypothetical protein